MIPPEIAEEDLDLAIKSHEKDIFDVFDSIDDKELYVFHSYNNVSIFDNTLYEHETDFIVLHKDLGIFFIESKASDAGPLYRNNNEWYYGNGKKMTHNPFVQAALNKHQMFSNVNMLRNPSLKKLLLSTKFMHCVCFPTMFDIECDRLGEGDGCLRDLIISKDDLISPQKLKARLEHIASIKLPKQDLRDFRKLSSAEAKQIVEEFLCRNTKTVPVYVHSQAVQNYSFYKLLKAQNLVLDFLDCENFVAITGGAGTGKTVVAVEKARRLASEGDNVIFLCFNKELQTRLEAAYKIPNVRFYTLAAFITALTGDYKNYKLASDKITEMLLDGSLLKIGNINYKHVIIDEAQDFGNDEYNIASDYDDREQFLNDLKDLILEKGSFYVFYDKQQLIQAKAIPKFIEEADSRLSLRKNVRNTENIGKMAMKSISDKRCFIPNKVSGDIPNFYFVQFSFPLKTLDKSISNYLSKGLKDIVIISLSTVKNSVLNTSGRVFEDSASGKFYYKTSDGNKIDFTSCRKFKGCEADVVILLDASADSFKKDLNGHDTKSNFLFYVGVSRAKRYLEVFASISDDDCNEILPILDGRYKNRPSKNPKHDFADSLGGNAIIV